jgi:hypothetical protein
MKASSANFVNIYVNDEDIRHLQRESTPVSAKDYGHDRAISCPAGARRWSVKRRN